jgi:hypothetical protein
MNAITTATSQPEPIFVARGLTKDYGEGDPAVHDLADNPMRPEDVLAVLRLADGMIVDTRLSPHKVVANNLRW